MEDVTQKEPEPIPGAQALRQGEPKKRYLGLDYGSRTVGVAVSDPLGITAQPVETIRRERETKLRRTLARIDELIAAYDAGTIVLGLPKYLNNTQGQRVSYTMAFKDKLEKRTGLPVILRDERLTTNEADSSLEVSGVRREDRKAVIDQVAACLILQGFLDSLQADHTYA